MIKQFMSQQEILNKQYNSYLDQEMKNVVISQGLHGISISAQNWMGSADSSQQLDQIKKEKEKMAQKLYPLNPDQEQLNDLFKQVKIRMQNTHAWFGGEQMTLWKLADIDD